MNEKTRALQGGHEPSAKILKKCDLGHEGWEMTHDSSDVMDLEVHSIGYMVCTKCEENI